MAANVLGVCRNGRLYRAVTTGFSLIEVTLAATVFCLILVGALRVQSESALPQRAFAWHQTQAVRLAERIVQRVAADLVAGRPIPLTNTDQSLTTALLEAPDFFDDAQRFAGGVRRDGTQWVTEWRAFYRVEALDGTAVLGDGASRPPAATPAPTTIGTGGTKLRRVRVRIDWGNKPEHRLDLVTLVTVP